VHDLLEKRATADHVRNVKIQTEYCYTVLWFIRAFMIGKRRN